ncbi:unnamed protein product [Discosporangium mesarthrocarpum]
MVSPDLNSAGDNARCVLADRALEHMSVGEARDLLRQLTSQVSQKQTELQLMVGSRYHELIESADSIVSMKDTAEEVMGLLQSFPEEHSYMKKQVPTSVDPDTGREGGLAPSSTAVERDNQSEVTRLMLNAPAAMWAALDNNRHFEAAGLLLKCRRAMATGPLSLSLGSEATGAAFLKSQCAYVEQFPSRITAAAKSLLGKPCNTEVCTGALASVLLIEGCNKAQPIRSLLELLLRRRGARVIKTCKRAMKEGRGGESEEGLCNAILAVQKTIQDVHAIFAPRQGERPCLLVELARVACPEIGPLGVHSSDVARLCTDWLSLLAPKIHGCSNKLLRSIRDANALARVRAKLWDLTHEVVEESGDKAQGNALGGESSWTEACAFAINNKLLRAHLEQSLNKSPLLPVDGKPIELWSLLFSCTFAELAETLLKDSLLLLRRDVESCLDAVLTITGASSLTTRTKGNHRSIQADGWNKTLDVFGSRNLMSKDILGAAQEVTAVLNSGLQTVTEDAWSLVQQGDQAAAEALERSLYHLCIDMVAGLANRLRAMLEEVHSYVKPAERQKPKGQASEEPVRENSGYERQGFADAGLIIGRIAWLLMHKRGRILRSVLSSPNSSAMGSEGRVEAQQLEAAFVIADTDGDGIVEADEAAEALQAISFGTSSAELCVDPQATSSFTLAEFTLFATRLLVEQEPHKHFISCLENILQQSISIWADWAIQNPAALLAQATEVFSCGCATPGMTDAIWQSCHGIWEEKRIELDSEGGEGVEESMLFPVVVSPAVLGYIETASSELSRIIGMADLASMAVAGGSSCDAEGVTEVQLGKGGYDLEKYEGLSPARCAQKVAASRAVADLKEAMSQLCLGPEAPVTGACEAVQMQLLLDALFLQEWLPCEIPSASVMDPIVEALSHLLDPVNLEIYMPHLKDAAASCGRACHTFLSSFFSFEAPVCTLGATPRQAPDNFLGTSSTFVPVAPKARRFELLPMPLDVVAHPAMRRPLIARSVGGSGVDQGSMGLIEGSDPSGQTKGIQVGRQALAGLIDQVGNVGNVLNAQNVNVQNMLGAASVFLGRQRK